MKIEFRQAAIEDSEILINIYNAAYYDDYLRYGYCPGYGITKEGMEESIRVFNKYIIMCDNMPVGCVSSKQMETGVYEVGNLCIIPEYQGKGIGTRAIQFLMTNLEDWKILRNNDV